MKVYTLKREQLIRRPRQDVFQFFERPENLEEITPGNMGFVILTPRPILMRAGAVLDYTVRVLGVRIRWTTLIESYDPPERFTDVSIKGPYSFWHHTHTFEEVSE
ncbi:CDP-paratose 2-epimerase, partial [candidate division GN15 bacterium]|nr:CDP-paratose 2-epimerase [candidate division GN15 bacterium]